MLLAKCLADVVLQHRFVENTISNLGGKATKIVSGPGFYDIGKADDVARHFIGDYLKILGFNISTTAPVTAQIGITDGMVLIRGLIPRQVKIHKCAPPNILDASEPLFAIENPFWDIITAPPVICPSTDSLLFPLLFSLHVDKSISRNCQENSLVPRTVRST